MQACCRKTGAGPAPLRQAHLAGAGRGADLAGGEGAAVALALSVDQVAGGAHGARAHHAALGAVCRQSGERMTTEGGR